MINIIPSIPLTITIETLPASQLDKSQKHSALGTEYGWVGLESHRHDGALGWLQPEAFQHRGNSHFGLHQSESHSDAVPGTLAEGQPRVGMPLGDVLLREAIGVEFLRFRIDFGIMVDSQDRDIHHGVLFEDQIRVGHFIVPTDLPPQHTRDGVLPEGFWAKRGKKINKLNPGSPSSNWPWIIWSI